MLFIPHSIPVDGGNASISYVPPANKQYKRKRRIKWIGPFRDFYLHKREGLMSKIKVCIKTSTNKEKRRTGDIQTLGFTSQFKTQLYFYYPN